MGYCKPVSFFKAAVNILVTSFSERISVFGTWPLTHKEDAIAMDNKSENIFFISRLFNFDQAATR